MLHKRGLDSLCFGVTKNTEIFCESKGDGSQSELHQGKGECEEMEETQQGGSKKKKEQRERQVFKKYVDSRNGFLF